MIVTSFSKGGRYHELRGMQNQDYVMDFAAPCGRAVILADGASGCRKGGEGARIACKAVQQIIREDGGRFFTYPADKMSYLLEEQILYSLEINGAKGKKLQEYGSTLSFAFLENRTGRCTCLNLGDGGIFAVNSHQVRPVLAPRKAGRGPDLTTSRNAWKAIHVRETVLPENGYLLIASDGFLNAMQDDSIRTCLEQENLNDLKVLLGKMKLPDDCSFIAARQEPASGCA